MDKTTNDAGSTIAVLQARLRGKSFRDLLAARGVTKYRLAKDTGISYRTLCFWQSGGTSPSIASAILVGKYLGILKPSDAEVHRLRVELVSIQKKIDRLTGTALLSEIKSNRQRRSKNGDERRIAGGRESRG